MKHIKIVFMLTIVVLISSVMVFYVEAWTTPIIDEYNFEQANIAKFEVLPALESTDSIAPDLTYDFTGTSITEVIIVPLKGYIYTAEFQGFQSVITYMVGIDMDGKITGFKTLLQGDTPGLGAEIGSDWYQAQFAGLSIDDLSGIDDINGATITSFGLKGSLDKVVEFHNVTFKGVVVETPEEKLARYKTEITVDGAVFTDVSSDYTMDDTIVKVELANDGTNDVAVIYTVNFSGFITAGYVEYIVSFDLETNDLLGLRVTHNDESPGIGQILSDESFTPQFVDMLQDDALNGNIDEVAGGSAPITYGAFKTSLNEVVLFHQSEFEGAVVETPEEKLARWKIEITEVGAVITDVSGDYTMDNTVVKMEIANDGSDDVAVIYTVQFSGFITSGYVEYIISFDLETNDVLGLRVTHNDESPGIGQILSDESFTTQFIDMLQDDALNGNIDEVAGGSAPITYGAFISSLNDVVLFHQAEFEGAVVETPEEKLARWKIEITEVGAVITDVSGDYALTTTVTKVEVANDGSNDVAVIYTARFTGYITSGYVEYIISFDLETNDIIGLRVTHNDETSGIGQILSDESFTTQFIDMLQADALNGNIDEVAASSAPITYGAFNDSLVIVVNFHKVEFEDEVIVRPDPIVTSDANLLEAFPGAASFNSVYLDYPEEANIYNVYEALDGSGNVLGYVYYAFETGRDGIIKFVLGVDLTGTTDSIYVTDSSETWDEASSSEYSDYDGNEGYFPDTPWLNIFEGLILSGYDLDKDIDGVAGVSTTTDAMILTVETIATYHTDNSVGGGN